MICKIWNIKPQKRSMTEGVRASLSYIMDSDKAKADFPDLETLLENQASDICPVLKYVKDEGKTKMVYVSGYMCDPQLAEEEFYLTKEINLARVGKTISDDTGNQAYHIVQSFPDDLDISDYEVHQCGIDLVRKLEKYQAVIASHLEPVLDEDGNLHGNTKHNHIIINSHMNPEFVDPKNPNLMKYHDCRETYMQLQQLNDEVAIEHGLPIINNNRDLNSYSWYENMEENEGRSWKKKVREDIKDAMTDTSSWDEYLSFMRKLGYTIYEGKHQTYTTPHNQKIRGKTLGEEYTREYIESYWEFRKRIQNQVSFELGKGEGTVSYDRLKALMNDKESQYFLKIPRINAISGENYSMLYPLSDVQDEKVVRTYFINGYVYSLYRGKDEVIGAVNGEVAAAVLTGSEYITYEEQKANEAAENEKVLKDDIKKVLEEEKNMVYTRKGWTSSKTGKLYSIGIYDDEGNKRSLLEQLFILAIVVITHEAPEYLLTEREKEPAGGTVIIVDSLPRKAQTLVETLKAVREEDINTISELEERLATAGKEIAKLNRQLRESEKVKAKMERVHEKVTVFEDPENSESASAGEILEKYYSISTAEDIEDFKRRFRECIRKNNELSINLRNMNEEYRKLKKISYHVKQAQDKDYCYGRDKDQFKEIDD